MRKVILTLAYFFSLVAGYSQTKLVPGYYITKNGDSIGASFRYTDSKITPGKIVAISDGKTVELTPNDVQKIFFNGYGVFESRDVTFHEPDFSITFTPEDFSLKLIEERAFLKVLEQGTYTLYSLTKTERAYYFVRNREGVPNELVYRVRKREMKIEEDNAFRKTLFELLSKEFISYEHSGRINRSTYTERDITPLIRAMNEKYGSSQRFVSNRKPKIQIDVMAGYIVNRFPGSFNGNYSQGNSFGTSGTATGGINFMYVSPTRFNSVAIGASVAYNQYSATGMKSDTVLEYFSQYYYNVIDYNEQYSLNNKLIMVDLYGLFMLNPHNRVNVFIKAGLNANIGVSSQSKILLKYHTERSGVRNGIPYQPSTEDKESSIKILGMYYNIRPGAGVIAGRNKFEFAYFAPVTLSGEFRTSAMGFHYYYALRK